VTLTPVEPHQGMWLKREDAHRLPCGVNGSKLRACQFLIRDAYSRGYRAVVSAASVLSPQNAMATVVAQDLGMAAEVIVGGTRPDTAIKHKAVRIAADHGATLHYIPVGYNPALQRAARLYAATHPGVYHLQYGITCPPKATRAEVRAFHAVGANQVTNLPPAVETLVVPFGSGNTAAGVLYGLSASPPPALRRVVLVGIGPDRQQWLTDRLQLLGVKVPVPVEHVPLYPGFAKYGDQMPGELDGVPMHPTYEGKIIRWAAQHHPDWWLARDYTTCLWVVGGPLAPGKLGTHRTAT
jgi:1-aminocyclopropane-1-carboxylate deaminase/D-cysteine desulfhydrase-like pyridoxal-dependent ACC family enzyme